MKQQVLVCLCLIFMSVCGSVVAQFLLREVSQTGTVPLIFGIDDAIIVIILVVVAIALAAVTLALQSSPSSEPLQPAKNDRPVSDPAKTIGYVMGRALIKEPIVIFYQEMGADPIFSDEGGK